ncbi:MAG: hypothetical protein K9N00_01395 [Candidatus Marinimicrobia bacterium]|nr:hypothetical protein [Candidatus Neomarinimicrobiota bacterium]
MTNRNIEIIKFTAIILGLIFHMSCDNTTGSESRLIEDMNFSYKSSPEKVFITALINQDKDVVLESLDFQIFQQVDSDYEQIEQGTLNDDGQNGDIIPDNGEYSFEFQQALAPGNYKCLITARADGEVADTISQYLEVFGDMSPSISFQDSTTEFISGDLIMYELEVSDPAGIENISKVFCKLYYPDNNRTPAILNARNDGEYGDQQDGDNIYTLALNTEGTKIHGLYHMEFWAVNNDNYSSDTLAIELRNPWMELVAPNGNNSLTAGSPVEVRWHSVLVDTIKIDYTLEYMQEDPHYELIRNVAAGDSSAVWNVPAELATDSALVRISSLKNERVMDTSDHFITIQ